MGLYCWETRGTIVRTTWLMGQSEMAHQLPSARLFQGLSDACVNSDKLAVQARRDSQSGWRFRYWFLFHNVHYHTGVDAVAVTSDNLEIIGVDRNVPPPEGVWTVDRDSLVFSSFTNNRCTQLTLVASHPPSCKRCQPLDSPWISNIQTNQGIVEVAMSRFENSRVAAHGSHVFEQPTDRVFAFRRWWE
jgi:hypothetical protein